MRKDLLWSVIRIPENMARLVKLLKFLEDPRYPCLGPHLRFLSLLGVWHPDLQSNLSRFKLGFFYVNICFFVSQYIKCLIKFDVSSLELLLQYAPFHIGVIKACFFQSNYKKWERLISFTSAVELHQISKKDNKQNGIISEYINRSRRVTYLFWAFCLFANISIFTEPYQKNQISENGTSTYTYIFDGFTPFSREPPGYYYSMIVQTVLGSMMSAYIISWDMLVVSIMIFCAGQLRMSRLYCKRSVDIKNAENSHRNIVECHQFHTTLVQYQKEFNDLISPVMSIYLFVICINLGVCIIQVAEIKDDFPKLASGCLYIVACLIQLLLFYWHANEVTVESQLVRYSTFKSRWIEGDKNIQKEIALLAQTTRKTLVFNAGPFNKMSLSTFIGILRASYSFYTLLKGTN